MASTVVKVKESLLGFDSDAGSEARRSFQKHCVVDESTGQEFLSEDAFVDAIAPAGEDFRKIKRSQYAILFDVADRGRTDRVTLEDWLVFNDLLQKPDADYEIAFRVFADPRTGQVDVDTFKETIGANKSRQSVSFDWDGHWAALYLGDKKHRHPMTYPQFAQMLRALQGERVRQAFLHYDKNGDGYIEPADFQTIIQETAAHKLSDHLLASLPSLCNISPGSKISYANVRAFLNVIRDMDLVELIIRNAVGRSPDGKITRHDFLDEAARVTRFSHFTPMEADILFHFASLDQPAGRLGLMDFARVLDPSWHSSGSRFTDTGGISTVAEKAVAGTTTVLGSLLVSLHHFGLGAIAGAFGAFMVYPIDLVKTRMQNQRQSRVGQLLYKNSIDCFSKVLRNEGARGLYSGVLPQLIGVAPEKAIKLTVNDLVRGKFTEPTTGRIPLWAELLAGGSAGGAQVIFTNPLEIVKIRLQVQGEAAKAAAREGEEFTKRSAMWIVRHLGLMGLYKGASACLLRDVPFSAIYFPAYSHLKRDMFGESPAKKLGVLQLLTAAAIAGMPAAYLTTPCDVIKTRLQVEARKGDTSYNGLRDAAVKVFREEGARAFFKGGVARVVRSSPQFGFTLAAYEVLQNALPMPGHETAPHAPTPSQSIPGLQEARTPLPYLRSRNALQIILDLDLGFSRLKKPDGAATGHTWLPKFRSAAPAAPVTAAEEPRE
ncbi:mitochondrial carrier [Piedraia hortae CBS 480.64]|uniref:Mitochondrial aspartate-glutamate transporter AGC1 n=1 Tax=Piedraia hortae CBS 480.64 TaxID=1314780 RepID=A0A6A7BTI3_9PEZI|nr:mitochondrial carrier [Piedraia hortae CBS 480.64]